MLTHPDAFRGVGEIAALADCWRLPRWYQPRIPVEDKSRAIINCAEK
jgi:hypothetical protein